MQINRLFEIIYLLLDNKSITAAELAERFEVSVRTVYRDIDALSQAGIPIYAVKGNGGGIRLMENFVLNKSVLTEGERGKILQSLQGMKAVRVEEVEPVLSKLSALFGGEEENWVEIDFSAWNPESPVSRKFAVLKEAVFSHRVVTFCYSTAEGHTENRSVEPVKLVFRTTDWYLYAWCRLRGDFRFFKLTRMEELCMTEEKLERKRTLPPANAKEFNRGEDGYAAKMVNVTVRISERMAYRILEEVEKERIERQEDGSYKVLLTMPENMWLYQYLFTFGEELEVLEPSYIREQMKQKLKKTLLNYQI